MKRYFTDNKKLFRFINSKKYDIKEIKPIRKHKRDGIFKKYYISSYCIIFDKIV